MACRDIAEGDRCSKRDPTARIVAAHDAGGIVARRIEPHNRLAVVTEDSRMLVSAKAGESSKVADDELHSVERTLFDPSKWRMG